MTLLLFLFVCARWASASPADDAFRAGDCHRCHEVPGWEPTPRVESCAVCHAWIRGVASDPAKRARAMEVFPLWQRYEENTRSYVEVPSLAASMARLDSEWIRTYLRDPHDLRPRLDETMPRFALTETQLDALVDAFESRRVSVAATPPPAASRVAAGEALFTSKGCAACHTYGARHVVGATPLSPDLAHTRDRMDADHVAAWIRDPKALSPDATMITIPLAEDEVLALRDYVLLAEPGWVEATPLGPDPKPTREPVRWADVESRVFGKICVHCHMNPATNEGRRGPGNAGGFGWPETGIELETPAGVAAVADRIPDALLRRRQEAHRDAIDPGTKPATLTRPEKPGMPLGLPPLSDEDISLVLGWLEQGMPP